MSTAENEMPAKAAKLPGESMACLQMAIGIWALVLALAPTIISWRHQASTAVGGLLLLAVALVPIVAGAKNAKAERAPSLMTLAPAVLAVAAVVLFILSSRSSINWSFPLSWLMLALMAFSALATRRYHKLNAAG